MTDAGMVIVGAGEAGARAAIELRECGYTGKITLIGGEARRPYERPPLSKAVLTESEEPQPAYILDNHRLAELAIDLLVSVQVTEINRVSHHITLSDGSPVPYEKLLLTTGASPRKLVIPGSDTSRVLHLRSFEDAQAIRASLLPGKHIVVIGGGFIGLEVAASARARGCDVTVVEAGPRILMRGVPEAIAEAVERKHRSEGVSFKIGVGLASLQADGEEQLLTLADGTTIPCDTIIAGIGAVPETALAQQAGLLLDNGIAVNDLLQTSDPDIYAAGDCCSFPHALYGHKRIRLEAWRNAQDQGIVAARNMAGAEERYKAVPWFWSDQYDVTLQVAGLIGIGGTTVTREQQGGEQIYLHLNDSGVLEAVSGIGSASLSKDIRLAEMLIERQAVLEPAALADPSVKLKALLTTIIQGVED
ncbi:NAD(P)/FAD-dependent oxidoreductase [Paenibacillus sp. GCM10023252]|uniref:NAD(P)/FAD-dependent oxidoreductase n=1 Tax=Paenibacillus sp. GCM10023252 TaxID=3252649 RepID=UPI00360EE78F